MILAIHSQFRCLGTISHSLNLKKMVCHSILKESLQEREKSGERDSRNGRDDKIIILI